MKRCGVIITALWAVALLAACLPDGLAAQDRTAGGQAGPDERPADGLNTGDDPPGWFTVPPGFTHGVGIAERSSYYPDRSYRQARERAVEDLNANTMTLVSVEYFSLGAAEPRRHAEVAIEQIYSEERVTPVDSARAGGRVYYLVAPPDGGTEAGELRSDPGDDEQGDQEAVRDRLERLASQERRERQATGLQAPAGLEVRGDVVRSGGYWFALGDVELSGIAPYRSWARSKQDGLKQLSRRLTTFVRTMRQYSQLMDAGSVMHSRSRVILQNVKVVERSMQNGRARSIVAVHEDDVIRLSAIGD